MRPMQRDPLVARPPKIHRKAQAASTRTRKPEHTMQPYDSVIATLNGEINGQNRPAGWEGHSEASAELETIGGHHFLNADQCDAMADALRAHAAALRQP